MADADPAGGFEDDAALVLVLELQTKVYLCYLLIPYVQA